jgi:hypothetical protein
MKAIFWAGSICGILDGISALVVFGALGIKPVRLFQGIASALLGPKSFQGGASTVALGVCLHFLIAYCAATVYYAASLRIPLLIDRALLCGVAFGIVVHLVMQFAVIPLSAIGPRPFVLRTFIIGLIVHMIVVGPSIALTISRWQRLTEARP